MSEEQPKEQSGGLEALTWMELVISYVLRSGVLLSAAVILVGILWFALTQDTGYARVLPHHLRDILTFHRHSGPGFFPTNLQAVVRGAAAGKPYAVIELVLTIDQQTKRAGGLRWQRLRLEFVT